MTAENNVDTTMKMLFTIQVKNRMHLANVLRKVRQLNGVQKIIRIKEDKEKLKIMISHNIQCGRDYSIMNGIDVEQFNNELKLIFGGK